MTQEQKVEITMFIAFDLPILMICTLFLIDFIISKTKKRNIKKLWK